MRKGTKKVKERRKRYCICMDHDELGHIKSLAETSGLSMSAYIRARIIYGNTHHEIRAKVREGVRF